MSSKARRIVNPYTGELLPEGYYMEEHRIVAPDGFAYPRNATTDQEDYWREADAAAARDMRELAKPYASREEMLADLHRDPPKGYTRFMASGGKVKPQQVAGTVVELPGLDIKSIRATTPPSPPRQIPSLPPTSSPDSRIDHLSAVPRTDSALRTPDSC